MIKTFYEQVLEEYDSSYSPYICDSSKTFKEYFSEQVSSELIRKHAFKFIESIDSEYRATTNSYFLFERPVSIFFLLSNTLKMEEVEKDINIRLNFLNYCIKNNLII